VGDPFTGPSSDYNQPFLLNIAMMQSPAKTVWIVDGGVRGIKDPDWKSYEFWWYDPPSINRDFARPRDTSPPYFQNVVARHQS
jgi:hypothetical protein